MVADKTSDASGLDLANLQGHWEQVGFEADGRPEPSDELAGPGVITTIKGCRFSVRNGQGKLLLEGTFALDASSRPKAITWTDSMGTDAGKQLPASYELDGDRFVFIAADESAQRPQRFRTEAGQVMRSFVRVR
ncbi:MAG: TIGR03067 domain-containing protein [Rhodanobacteraceae bacterium]